MGGRGKLELISTLACLLFSLSFSRNLANHNLDLDTVTDRRWLETQPICCVSAGFAESEADLTKCIRAAKEGDPELKRVYEMECPKYIMQGENPDLEVVIRQSECSSLATDRGVLCSKYAVEEEEEDVNQLSLQSKYEDCDALSASTRTEVVSSLAEAATTGERCLCREGYLGHIPSSVAGRVGVGCQWRASDLEKKLDRLQTCKCRGIGYTTMSHCHLEESCLNAEADYTQASDVIISRNNNQPPSDACFAALDAAICAYHFSYCTSDSSLDRFPTVCKTTCDNLYSACNVTLNEVTLIEKCPGQLTNGEWDENLGRDADDEDCTARASLLFSSPFAPLLPFLSSILTTFLPQTVVMCVSSSFSLFTVALFFSTSIIAIVS